MKSVMQHNFSQVPKVEIQRSSFNRSHGCKTTFDSGYLVPIFVDEALPGDSFNLNMTVFARLATPLHPFMDNLFMDTHFFAVPIRLIWDNWQKMNGEQIDPGDSTDYLVPQMVAPNDGTGYTVGSLSDYLTLPVQVPNFTHSSLWHRAYNLIYNEWFRDENLQDSVVVDRDDGPDSPSDYVLLRRGKRHDYFTSCLPWPQKGPSIDLPLGTTAPVVSDGLPIGFLIDNAGSNNALAGQSGNTVAGWGGTNTQSGLAYMGDQGLVTDLTSATAATINQLREAFQVQRLYERDARGGTRYTEIIRAHFGVVSPDARLQRPEYLGGGSTPININPIAQTSSTDATTPQGNLAAIGHGTLLNHGFTKSFTEHCVLIGLISVRADLNYQQGLNRMFSRESRFDFYWPALSHLGEQAVFNKEIYCQNDSVVGGTGDPENIEAFGYQERYAEYRYKPSVITGQFRSVYAQTLDTWHLAQDYDALPVLNEEFIVENPPVDRVIAVEAPYPQFLFDSFFDLKCARPMPVYSVPGLIDHF
jgi:hypothetical protein